MEGKFPAAGGSFHYRRGKKELQEGHKEGESLSECLKAHSSVWVGEHKDNSQEIDSPSLGVRGGVDGLWGISRKKVRLYSYPFRALCGRASMWKDLEAPQLLMVAWLTSSQQGGPSFISCSALPKLESRAWIFLVFAHSCCLVLCFFQTRFSCWKWHGFSLLHKMPRGTHTKIALTS